MNTVVNVKPEREYLRASELAFMLQFVEQTTENPAATLLSGGMIEPSGAGLFRLTERGMMHIRKLLRTPVSN